MNTFWLRITVVSACILVASIGTAAILVFLGMMSYMALREATTPAFAATLTVFGGGVVVAIAVTAAYLMLNQERRTKAAKGAAATDGEDRVLSEIAGVLGGELAHLIRTKPYASSLAALAAGFAVGAVPELRSGLSHFIAKR